MSDERTNRTDAADKWHWWCRACKKWTPRSEPHHCLETGKVVDEPAESMYVSYARVKRVEANERAGQENES